jgi:hypothetical protein
VSKSDNRAELDRLMANFKGEIKICPRKAALQKVIKRTRKSKSALAEVDARIQAAETTMRVEAAPTGEAKTLVKEIGQPLPTALPDVPIP